MTPGEIITGIGEMDLSVGADPVTKWGATTDDRPVRVGSHDHFGESNAALSFERDTGCGMPLAIAVAAPVRFKPDQTREVTLAPVRGAWRIFGNTRAVMGALD